MEKENDRDKSAIYMIFEKSFDCAFIYFLRIFATHSVEMI